MRRLTVLLVAVAVVIVLGASDALAQTHSQNLGVSASVTGSCRVRSATTVAFGAYDPLVTHNSTGVDLDNTGSLNIACTKGTASATLGLSNGGNYTTTRRMSNGASDYLNYELYKETGRTNRWGDAVVGDRLTLSPVPGVNGTDYTVYGRVPRGQDIATGSYTDTVVATVYW